MFEIDVTSSRLVSLMIRLALRLLSVRNIKETYEGVNGITSIFFAVRVNEVWMGRVERNNPDLRRG